MNQLFFKFDNNGYNQAKQWVKDNNLQDRIKQLLKKEPSTDRLTYVMVVNQFRIKYVN